MVFSEITGTYREYFIIFIFLFGIVIGSFLNVCIYRIPLGMSVVWPGSHCTKCNTQLKILDLIPVLSYLLSRGKCRYCGEKYSSRYLIVELLNGLVYVFLFLKYGLSPDFFASVFLMSVLIIVFFIDLDYLIIPDSLVVLSLIGGMIFYVLGFYYRFAIYGVWTWWNAPLGMVLSSSILFLVASVGRIVYKTDEAMGFGDIKIIAPIGLFLGWKMAFVCLFFSVLLGAICGIILLTLKIKKAAEAIPFGPFIVSAVFATYIFGWSILNWWIGFI